MTRVSEALARGDLLKTAHELEAKVEELSIRLETEREFRIAAMVSADGYRRDADMLAGLVNELRTKLNEPPQSPVINDNPTARKRAESRGWKCPDCGKAGVYMSCDDCGWIDTKELDTPDVIVNNG